MYFSALFRVSLVRSGWASWWNLGQLLICRPLLANLDPAWYIARKTNAIWLPPRAVQCLLLESQPWQGIWANSRKSSISSSLSFDVKWFCLLIFCLVLLRASSYRLEVMIQPPCSQDIKQKSSMSDLLSLDIKSSHLNSHSSQVVVIDLKEIVRPQ